MDKAQALARLQALENETAALRKIIEAPDAAATLLQWPDKWDQQYWQVTSQLNGAVGARSNRSDGNTTGGNCFATQKQAEAYADAIETMLLLRHQPGTVPPNGDAQYYIRMTSDLKGIEFPTGGESANRFKACMVSPCFSSLADANTAALKVGVGRILRMFKTLHHIAD